MKKQLAKIKELTSSKWYIFIILIFGLIATMGVWSGISQFLYGYDAWFHVARFSSIIEALKDGQFFPIISPKANQGFGYAFNLFYGPLAAIVTSFFGIFLDNWAIISNIFLVCCIIASGFTMFVFVDNISNKNKILSTIAAIIFMFAPYHLFDLYTRYAVGELLVLVFAPLLFLGLYQLINQNKWAVFNISFSAIMMILSHNLSSILFAIAAFIFLFLNIKQLWNKESIKKIATSALIIIGCTAFFVFPLLEATKDTSYFLINPETAELFNHMSGESVNQERFSFINLFFNSNSPHFAKEKCAIGIFATIGLLGFPFFRKNMPRENKSFLTKLYIIGIIFLLGTTSFIDWGSLPHIFRTIQFPWRLLLVFCFIESVIASFIIFFIIERTTKNRQQILVVIIGVFCMISSNYFINPTNISKKPESPAYLYDFFDYVPTSTFYNDDRQKPLYDVIENGWSANRLWVLSSFLETYRDKITTNKDILIRDFYKEGTTVSFYAENSTNTAAVLEAPLFYYPGYEAHTSNGQKIDTKESENGLVSISVDPGFSNSIVIKRGMSLWQKIGVITSIITGVCLFVYKIRKRKGKNV